MPFGIRPADPHSLSEPRYQPSVVADRLITAGSWESRDACPLIIQALS
jgi:hypothetical protein